MIPPAGIGVCAALTLPDRHCAGACERVRPFAGGLQGFTPCAPANLKAGRVSSDQILVYYPFPGWRLAGPPAAPKERLGSARKKEARKVCDLPGSQASKLLAPLLRAHDTSSILRPVGHHHPLAKHQQIKNFISASGHNAAAVLRGGNDSHGALALVWNGCTYKPQEYPAYAEERPPALLDSTL